jgi:hypothetical protein
MFLPLFTLLLPLVRLFPPGFRWRMRSRIYHWYRNLEEVDFQGHQSTAPEEVHSFILKLERLAAEVRHVAVPLSYAGELYTLRIHIAHVQESLRRAAAVLRGEGKISTEQKNG